MVTRPLRVLVLTFYWTPDLSAGSFRAAAFVEALDRALPDGSSIDVLTTRPNRYSSFAVEAAEEEQQGRIRVRRFTLPAHRSGMRDQARAFAAFARGVLAEVRGRRYDVVFATSSRMFTALLGALAARRVAAPLYLDIRDIFNDTIKDLLKGRAVWALLPGLNAIERFTIGSASKVNLVSRGFLPYFERRFPRQQFSIIPNGVDEEFIGADFSSAATPDARGTVRVVCAGNVGHGQGLHRIVPGLAARTASRGYVFEIIGAGSAEDALRRAIAESGATNIVLSPPIPRRDLLARYREADVLFLHLNDFDAFRKVVPSKVFEYAATGKPILAGVAGHAADFIAAEIAGAAVFPPCDVDAAERALAGLPLAMTPRAAFVEKYRRGTLMAALAADCLSIVGQERVR